MPTIMISGPARVDRRYRPWSYLARGRNRY